MNLLSKMRRCIFMEPNYAVKLIKIGKKKKKALRKSDIFKSCRKKSSAGAFLSTSVWVFVSTPWWYSWKFFTGSSLGRPRTCSHRSQWQDPAGEIEGARGTTRNSTVWLQGVGRLREGCQTSKPCLLIPPLLMLHVWRGAYLLTCLHWRERAQGIVKLLGYFLINSSESRDNI